MTTLNNTQAGRCCERALTDLSQLRAVCVFPPSLLPLSLYPNPSEYEEKLLQPYERLQPHSNVMARQPAACLLGPGLQGMDWQAAQLQQQTCPLVRGVQVAFNSWLPSVSHAHIEPRSILDSCFALRAPSDKDFVAYDLT